MNFYLWTIGCQMNFADSRRAAEELQKLGYREVDRPRDADLILLNTCVVRQSAEDKVTGRLTSLLGLKRRKPEVQLALMGSDDLEWGRITQQKAEFSAAVTRVIDRAVASGQVRADLTLADFTVVASGVISTMYFKPGGNRDWRRHLQLVLDGIRR